MNIGIGRRSITPAAVMASLLLLGPASAQLQTGVALLSTSGSPSMASIISAAPEAGHVLKASKGNLYDAYVTTGATPGFLLIFDAISVPGDGAVTPTDCVPVGAGSWGGISYGPGLPEAFSTGITAAFSSTGCFTKTASATAFFHGRVQ